MGRQEDPSPQILTVLRTLLVDHAAKSFDNKQFFIKWKHKTLNLTTSRYLKNILVQLALSPHIPRPQIPPLDAVVSGRKVCCMDGENRGVASPQISGVVFGPAFTQPPSPCWICWFRSWWRKPVAKHLKYNIISIQHGRPSQRLHSWHISDVISASASGHRHQTTLHLHVFNADFEVGEGW